MRTRRRGRLLSVRVAAALAAVPCLLAACSGDSPAPTLEVTTPAGMLEDIRATAAAPTPTQRPTTASGTPATTFTPAGAIEAVTQYLRDQRDPSLPSSVTRLQLGLLTGREFTSFARWDGTRGRWRVTIDRESFWFFEATQFVEYIAVPSAP